LGLPAEPLIMSPRSRTRVAAAGVACIGLGAAWIFFSAVPEKRRWISTNNGSPANRPPTAIETGSIVPLEFVEAEGEATLEVAMDELCIKGGDGVETLVKLDPPATPATFRSRVAELAGRGEWFPIAYPAGSARDESGRRLITRKLRVKLPAAEADRVAASSGLTLSERPEYAPDWVILEAPDPLAALAAVGGVRASQSVESADVLMGRKRFTRDAPNDPHYPNQWHLKNTTTSPSITHLNVESVWSFPTPGAGARGRGIRIGIVDDGLQTGHPDFAGNVDTTVDWDWNGNDADPSPVSDGNPPLSYGDYHGTAVGGLIGAKGNNALGVCGIAPESKLVGMRLIGAATTDAQEADAMNHRNDIIQIKNNSWGPSDRPTNLEGPDPLTKSAFANAVATGRGGKGTVFVWAGGNGKLNSDNSNYDGYANSIETIAVGGINNSGVSSTVSEPGANLLVVAPSGGGGVGLTTTDRTDAKGRDPGDYYTGFSGTSAATACVSGVVALMLEKNPDLGWRDVQEILIRSATKVSPADPGWHTNGAGFSFNHQFGAGLANASAAVTLSQGWTNLPAQAALARTHSGSAVIPENTATGVSKAFTFAEKNHRVEHATVSVDIAHSDRGNLKITLVSPSGTESVLANVFTHDLPAANYNWTFSSVHHWGENARGTWTLKVADLSSTGNTTGGALNSVTLTLYGSAHDFPDTDPSVTSASVAPGFRAFADEPLRVTSVSGVDPLGGTVSYGYQWQSSTDGNVYVNEPGETAEALSISPGHAGKLWRCAVTPSNGATQGDVYHTDPVNVLARPPAFVKTGANFSYTPGLVIANQGSSSWFGLAGPSDSVDGLIMNPSTGAYSGTVAASAARGVRTLVFERQDAQGNVISFAFPLRVVAGNYAQWAGDHSLAKSEPPVDNDDDGIPNLIEYLLDLDATVTDVPSPVIFARESGGLTLTYRESKIPSDGILVAEWATELGDGAIWQSTGMTSTVLEEDETSRLIKASLPISPDDPKRFLRLKGSQIPQ
jgi:subtilisin-like proprotein convertase family protein